MALIRPRLTDYHGVHVAQAELDFAVPLLDADIPLYVDPFLLWRSASQQDQALHTGLVNSFNRLGWLLGKGRTDEAVEQLVIASECDEVGLGTSRTRRGKRLGANAARDVLQLFEDIPPYRENGFSHFEEIQFYVNGISKDRISDITCSFLKKFLCDYSLQVCEELSIPTAKTRLDTLYDSRKYEFLRDVEVELPINPEDGRPIILVPKRWLRHVPYIGFDDFFIASIPKDDLVNGDLGDDRGKILTYNRRNYDVVRAYVQARELASYEAKNDPLFGQIPVASARAKLKELKSIPTGTGEKADKRYEKLITELMASLLYPDLDFASDQVRVENGASIRDLIFYNNRTVPFLDGILADFGTRQIVFEMKNVKAIERDHINQLNRYLVGEFGSFGIFLTRNAIPKPMMTNIVNLWAGQRKAIIALTDDDVEEMVALYDGKQRPALDIVKRAYVRFTRLLPV